MTFAISPSNAYGTAKWIVSATAGQGTHTTIQAAITAASSGDVIFIREGSYTENLTLKAGVDLTTFGGNQVDGNVTIIGKCTLTVATTINISNIRLQTNSDFFLAVTGSAASIINLNNCYLNCSNNTGISYTSSSSSSSVIMNNCTGNIGTTGITLFTMSSTGTLLSTNSSFTNTGGATTASTISAGLFGPTRSVFGMPITTSSTGAISSLFNDYECAQINTTALTVGGSGGVVCRSDSFTSGSASSVSISSTATLANCQVDSTNTNAITGVGTLTYTDLYFTGSSSTINVTTQTIGLASAFQRTNIQTFTSSGTYTPTTGMKYCIMECVGSGAGGGGTASAAASTFSGGGGGGGGSYARKYATAVTVGSSQTVTVGNAGTGGTAGNNAGTNGNDVSVGTICVGKGGTAGSGNSGSATGAGGAGGVAGTGDFTVPGFPGFAHIAQTSAGTTLQSFGGDAALGFGAGGRLQGNSTPATGASGSNYGAGGSGGISFSASGAAAGGPGSKGIVIITEYI